MSGFFQKIRKKRCLFQRFVTSIVTLSQCIHICRFSETSARQLKAINQEDVRYMYVKEEKKPLGERNKTSPLAKSISESSGQKMVCRFCARQHPFAKKKTVLCGELMQELW